MHDDRPRAAPAAPHGHRREAEIRALIEETRAPVRALMRRWHVAPASADDIVQVALFTVAQIWDHLRDPTGYFFGAVRHGIRRHFTAVRRDREGLARFAAGRPLAAEDPRLHEIECRDEVRALLAGLPPPAARLLVMRYAEGLSSREVAVALGRSEAAVRQAASRALRQVRRQALGARAGGKTVMAAR